MQQAGDLVDPVLPAFLPGEVLLDELFQPDAAEEVVQAPPGGDVPDDQDPLLVPAERQVAEEAADAGDGLPPAFPARVGPVARPSSLSTVVEWVSKTSSIATSQP